MYICKMKKIKIVSISARQFYENELNNMSIGDRIIFHGSYSIASMQTRASLLGKKYEKKFMSRMLTKDELLIERIK